MADNVLKLYNALKDEGIKGIGDEKTFLKKVSNDESRKKLYDFLEKRGGYSDLGDYSTFSSKLGFSGQDLASKAPVAGLYSFDIGNDAEETSGTPLTPADRKNLSSFKFNVDAHRPNKVNSLDLGIKTETNPYALLGGERNGLMEAGQRAQGTFANDPSKLQHTPLAKPEESGFWSTYLGDLAQRFGAGAQNAVGNTYKILEKGARTINDLVGDTSGTHTDKNGNKQPGFFGEVGNAALQGSEELKAKSDRYNGQNFVDLAKDGKYGKMAGEIMLTATESLPLSIAAAFGGGAGLVGIGAISANQQYDQLDQDKDLSETQKVIDAGLNGTFEAASELLGSVPAGKMLKDVYTRFGKDVAKKQLKTGIAGWMQKTFKGLGVLYPPVGEGLEEVSSQIAQNLTDKYTGVDPNKDVMDGVLESFVYGAGGGAQFSAAAIPGMVTNAAQKRAVSKEYNRSYSDVSEMLGNGKVDQFDRMFANIPVEQRPSFVRRVAENEGLDNEQSKTLMEYAKNKAMYDNYLDTVDNEIEASKQQAIDDIDKTTNKDMGSVVLVNSGISQNPINIIGGNVAFDNEGYVDKDNSSEVIYYIDPETSKRKMGSPDLITSLVSSVPIDQAYADAMQTVTEEIVQREESELNDPVDEIAPGMMVETPNGPAEVVQNDESGQIIVVDQNGQTFPVDVNMVTPAQIEGEIQPQGGPVDNQQNTEIASSQSTPEEVSDAQGGPVEYPRDKEGNVDYKQITDPSMYAGALTEEFGEDAPAVLDDLLSEANEALQKAEKKGNAIERRRAIKVANNNINRLNEIKNIISPVQETTNLSENNPGNEVSPQAEQSILSPKEQIRSISESSNDPREIADTYKSEMEKAGYESLLPWQQALIGRRVNRASFERFGDRNQIGRGVGRSWFNQKGEEKATDSIDVLAEELSEYGVPVSPFDIVNFILEHPNNRINKGNEITKALNNRFKQVVKELTGEDVGNIDSRSGRLILLGIEAGQRTAEEKAALPFDGATIPDAFVLFVEKVGPEAFDNVNSFEELEQLVQRELESGTFEFPLSQGDYVTIQNIVNHGIEQQRDYENFRGRLETARGRRDSQPDIFEEQARGRSENELQPIDIGETGRINETEEKPENEELPDGGETNGSVSESDQQQSAGESVISSKGESSPNSDSNTAGDRLMPGREGNAETRESVSKTVSQEQEGDIQEKEKAGENVRETIPVGNPETILDVISNVAKRAEINAAEKEVNQNPTEAQKEAESDISELKDAVNNIEEDDRRSKEKEKSPKTILDVVEDAAKKSEAKENKKTASVSSEKASSKIEDFGEKIGGARKDIAQKYKQQLSEINKDNVKEKPLSKIFPRPNFKELVDSGALSVDNALFLNMLYESIPTKPRVSYKLNLWVQTVEKTVSKYKDVLENNDKTNYLEVLKDYTIRRRSQGTYYKNNEPYQLSDEQKLLIDETWLNIQTLKSLGFPSETTSLKGGKIKYRVSGPENIFDVNIGNKRARFTTYEDAVDYLKNEISNPQKKETVFNIYSFRNMSGYFIARPIQGKEPIRLSEVFNTLKEARDYLRDHRVEIQTKWDAMDVKPEERRTENRDRQGRDWRNGNDVRPEQFQDVFGFRGTEFGNWVNQNERQAALNNAYDALMDLSSLLNISPKAISLNGELGMAFGARGTGNAGGSTASAHYEPDKIVINLTKKSGAGSLAHEWWHALDNYFSRRGGQSLSFATEGIESINENVRQEMKIAFDAVMKSVNDSELPKRSRKLDGKRSKDYWSTNLEMSARAFENYISSKLAEREDSNDYLANFKEMGEWILSGQFKEDTFPYPTNKETPSINEKFDQLFDTIQEKVDEETGNTVLYRENDTNEDADNLDNSPSSNIFTNENNTQNEISNRSAQEELRGSDENNLSEQEVSDRIREGIGAIESQRNGEKLSIQNRADEEKRIVFDYAKNNNLWIDNVYSLGNPTGVSGNENTLALNDAGDTIYKSNNLFNSNGLISKILESVRIHNTLFPNAKYELVGFTGIDNGKNRVPYVEPIFKQDFVPNSTNVTPEEIAEYMKSLGFDQVNEHTFTNGQYTVSDLRPRNVLKDENGFIHVIDDIAKETNPVEKEVLDEAKNLSSSLNTPVRIITDTNEIPENESRKRNAKGWYDTKTGEVAIVLPNNTSVADVQATILHEVVAHKGLRGLLGDKFDDMMDTVYKNLPDEVRTNVSLSALNKYSGDFRTATEEYLASIAEKGVEEPAVWNKIKSAIKEFFRSIGVNFKMTDQDIMYLLWKSKNRLERGDSPFDVIQKVAKDAEVRDALYRSIDDTKFNYSDKLDEIIKKNKARRAFVDQYQPLRALEKIVEESSSKKLGDFEKASLLSEVLQSVDSVQIEEWNKLYMSKIYDGIKSFKKKYGVKEDRVLDYMKVKSGSIRNERMRTDEATETGAPIDETKDFAGVYPVLGKYKDANYTLDNAGVQKFLSDFENDINVNDIKDLWSDTKSGTNKILEIGYKSGLIGREIFLKYSNDDNYYLPLRGWANGDMSDIYDYGDVGGAKQSFQDVMKKAEGRVSEADNPIAYIKMLGESEIMRANKNKMLQAVLRMVRNRPMPEIYTVNKIYEVLATDPNSGEDVWMEVMNKPDEQMFVDGKARTKFINHEFKKAITPYMLKENQVVAYELGEKYVITFTNPDIAKSIKGELNQSIQDKAVLTWLSSIQRFMSAAFTKYNPEFFLWTNLMRDVQMAGVVGLLKEGPKYVVDFSKTLPIAINSYRRMLNGKYDSSNEYDVYMDEFIRSGGETGYAVLKNLEKTKKEIEASLKNKKTLKQRFEDSGVIGTLTDIGRVTEGMTRFSAYCASRVKGKSILQSTIDAKNITVNFNKRGSGETITIEDLRLPIISKFPFIKNMPISARAFQTGFVFFNASIQGADVLYQVTKENKGKMALVASSFYAAGFLMSMIGRMLMGYDDDKDMSEYDKISDFVRRNNLIIPLGGKNYISIPLPQILRGAYGLGEMAYSSISGNMKGQNLGLEAASSLTDDLSPIDVGSIRLGDDWSLAGIIPSAVRPLWEAYIENKDFMGRSIAKSNSYNSYDPEYKKVFARTGVPWVEASKLLNNVSGGDEVRPGWANINPAKIEHIAQGYFGGLLSFGDKSISRLFDISKILSGENVEIEARDVPIVGKMYGRGSDAIGMNNIRRRFYKYGKDANLYNHVFKKYEDSDNYAKLDKFSNDDLEDRYYILKDANSEIGDLKKYMKDASDDKERSMWQDEIDSIIINAVLEYEKTEKEDKKK